MTEKVYYTKTGKLIKHGGKGTAYANYGCRCEECIMAQRLRVGRQRKARDPNNLPEDRHGLVSTYVNWNCRCDLCKDAQNTATKNQYYARKNA